MVKQPDLFRPMLAATACRQGELFERSSEAAPECPCGRPMVVTPSGYLTCPAGHGRLLQPDDPCGMIFED